MATPRDQIVGWPACPARVLACRPDGGFEHDLTFAYELARRPI